MGLCKAGQRYDTQPGTFEHHIKKVEERFWGERFTKYDAWRKKLWKDYLANGYFRMLTGFLVKGVYKRNEVINSPVQGAAFHCLLWALIRLVKWLRKSKMRSRVVGQIHDSIIADVHRSELQDYLAMARQLLVVDIREYYRWLDVIPLGVEAEVAESNWWEKHEVAIPE